MRRATQYNTLKRHAHPESGLLGIAMIKLSVNAESDDRLTKGTVQMRAGTSVFSAGWI